jgi:hypothetical protein
MSVEGEVCVLSRKRCRDGARLVAVRAGERGRYLVTTRAVAVGEVVLVDEACVAMTFTRAGHEVVAPCDHYPCFRAWEGESTRCEGCRRMRYCSQDCADAAWLGYHQLECATYSQRSQLSLPDLPHRFILRCLAVRACRESIPSKLSPAQRQTPTPGAARGARPGGW